MWRPCHHSRFAMSVSSTPHRSPQPDSSVRNPGKNSTRWRSPAAGSTPNRSSSSSFTRLAASRSPFVHTWPSETFSCPRPSGNAIASGSPARSSACSTTSARSASPSLPSTSSSVTSGRWLTPATVGAIAKKGTSRSRLIVNCMIVTSWQRPTVVIGDSRVTARQMVVMGFVRLRSHASGQTASMSRTMSRKTGMLRSARLMPPGPTVSPTDCRMPYRSGISRSWRIDAKPPVEIVTTT